MVDKRSEIILGYKTDTASVNKAIQQANRLSNNLTGGARQAQESTEKLVNASKNLINQLKLGTEQANDFYNQVNQDVGLAGNVASNAGQVAGALSAIGASNATAGLETLVTAGDVLEGLPRLKTSIAGIPSIIGSIASALGPVGLGLTAVAGLAVDGFTKLSGVLEEARKRGEEYAQVLINTSENVADAKLLLAKGDVSGVIQQLADAQQERLQLTFRERELSEELTTLQAKRLDRSSGQLGFFDELADRFDTVIQEIDGSISAVTTSLDELVSQSVTADITIQELTQLLLDYGLTIEQIEAEIAKLDQTTEQATETIAELNTALLAQADATRARYLEEINLLDQSEQALQERQKQIEAEIQANQKAIDVLVASGDTSEQVTAQIEKYRQANEELGKTLEFIGNTALPSATARAQAEQQLADTKQTQEDIINATKKFNADVENLNESSQSELLKIEENRTKNLLNIAQKYADETERALQKLNEDLENARNRYTEDELKAREDALREERDASRKHYEALADISVNAKREEQDALRGLDFKGAFEARRNANRAITDEQKKFVRERKDRQTALGDERQDRLRAYEQAQRDAQANYQKELQTARQARDKALQEARANYERELQLARNSQAQKLQALQTGYMQELMLAQQTSAQRLAIQQALDAQILASARRILTSGFGGIRPQNFNNYRGGTPPPNLRPPSRVNQQNLERQRAMDMARERARGGGINININNPNNPRRTADQVKTIINNNRGGG